MSAPKVLLRSKLLGGTIALLLLVPAVAHAEVGLASPSGPVGQQSMTLYSLSISDDPDPIMWGRFTPEGFDRYVLNPLGQQNGDGPPSVLFDAVSHLAIVAWARNSASGFDVVVSHSAGGAWSEPEVVAGGPANELDPFLIAASDGTVHLFYWEDGATPRVMHSQAPADLSSWSVVDQVSGSDQPACRPEAAFHEGVLYVAYEVHDYGFENTPRQVVLARQEGTGFTPEIMAITHNAGVIFPQVHSFNGRIWVDWIDASGEMAWTRQDSQGNWEPIRYEPFGSTEEREFFVRGTIRYEASLQP